MRLCIGSDHGGFEFKTNILLFLNQQYPSYSLKDMGTYTKESCDYPDFADAVVQDLLSKRSEMGILICGTGIGMSIQANRYKGIRAALVHDIFTAENAKKHNNANILCLGARVLSQELAFSLIATWLNTPFEGGRHEKRIEKLDGVKFL